MEITFDGYCGRDAYDKDVVLDWLNIWPDYGDRSKPPILAVRNGSKGLLLDCKGNRCEVQVGSVTGFVHKGFVKELKTWT